ncbi:hypothetical protein L9F63_017142, partial [Diploptera punctata]
MVPVIVRIHHDENDFTEVPVTPYTTVKDVVECSRDPGFEPCQLLASGGERLKSLLKEIWAYKMQEEILVGKFGRVPERFVAF